MATDIADAQARIGESGLAASRKTRILADACVVHRKRRHSLGRSLAKSRQLKW